MHIYDFFTDTFQDELKRQSREIEASGRYEKILLRYKSQLESIITSLDAIDSKYLDAELKENEFLQNWFIKLTGYVIGQKEVISRLMDDIYDCYLIFVRGKHHSAVIKMHDILEKYDLLDFAYQELLGGFFRIRKPGKDEDIFNENFNLHLPFSKRHLVSNQRFSFSGIPILYLGGSVMDCYFEYDDVNLDSTEYGITFFGFNPVANRQLHPHKGWTYIKKKDKIFDITNQILDVIQDLFYEHIVERKRDLKQTVFPGLEYENLARLVRKFILSQVCTFPKIKQNPSQSFFEEYIIPQLLTEAIRLHKYDGILYPSTKFGDKKIGFKSPWRSNLYKTNLAMFTEYDSIYEYDVQLVNNFAIFAKPFPNIRKYDLQTTVASLKEEMQRIDLFLDERDKSEIKMHYKVIIRHISKKIRIYENIIFDGKPYLETFAGKADIEHLREYFISIAKLIFRTYHIEIQKEEEEKNLNEDLKNKNVSSIDTDSQV